MIVGKNGANIKKAQALPGVHRIDIRQDGMISIVADTPQAGKDARSMLEVTQEKVKIQPQEVRVQRAPRGSGFLQKAMLEITRGKAQIRLSSCRFVQCNAAPISRCWSVILCSFR